MQHAKLSVLTLESSVFYTNQTSVSKKTTELAELRKNIAQLTRKTYNALPCRYCQHVSHCCCRQSMSVEST